MASGNESDVEQQLEKLQQQAEKLKIKFGSALAEEVYDNRIISIPGLRGRDHKEVSEKNLARIIQARVEEILDYVIWEVRRSGFERKLIAGIVLTGGGALLNHIDKLAEYHTGMSTRIGVPVEHLAHGYHEQLSSPIYATGVGLLMKGLDDLEAGRIPTPEVVQENEEEFEEDLSGKWYEQLFRKTKEWFEAEPDSEF